MHKVHLKLSRWRNSSDALDPLSFQSSTCTAFLNDTKWHSCICPTHHKSSYKLTLTRSWLPIKQAVRPMSAGFLSKCFFLLLHSIHHLWLVHLAQALHSILRVNHPNLAKMTWWWNVLRAKRPEGEMSCKHVYRYIWTTLQGQ